MPTEAELDLNDSGQFNRLQLYSGGLIHQSQEVNIPSHRPLAWKLHIGLDAPVWLTSSSAKIPTSDGFQVVLTAPGYSHANGARGRVVVVFIEPGICGMPVSSPQAVQVLKPKQAAQAIRLGKEFASTSPSDTGDYVQALSTLVSPKIVVSKDTRVEWARSEMSRNPDISLKCLAEQVQLSEDHLCRLIRRYTGQTYRQLRLWYRLFYMGSHCDLRHLTPAAHAAGFSDHAHMTRTFVRFFGNTPSSILHQTHTYRAHKSMKHFQAKPS